VSSSTRAILVPAAAGLALLLGWAGPARAGQSRLAGDQSQAQDQNHVVIVVGGKKMTAGDVERFIQSLPPPYRTFYRGAGKHLLPQVIVRMKVLAAQARKENLEESSEVQRAIHIATESILANAAEKNIRQNISVSSDEIQKAYEARKAEFEQVHVRSIFMRAKASVGTQSPGAKHSGSPEGKGQKKLEEIRKKLVRGADFAQLAEKYSEDVTTAKKGGDMGYVQLSKMPPALASAVNSLRAGQLSDVVPLPYGYELIQVLDKRTESLDDVKSSLETQIRQQKFENALNGLAQKYNVWVDTEFFAGQNPESPPPEKPPASPLPAKPGGRNPGSSSPAKPR
jgi:PPIC-type PPIASE domain